MAPDDRHTDQGGALLLRVLRAALDGGAREPLRLTSHEWDGVLRHARWHGIGALLAHQLLASRDEIPPGVIERLRLEQRAAAARGLRVAAQLAELLRALRAADVPVVPLKGAALAESLYGSFALRPMRDIDVLVPVDALERAERTLLALGYGPSHRPSIDAQRARWHHLEPLRRGVEPRVEVHWTLEMPGNPFAIDLEALWRRTRPARIAGEEALLLAAEDQLLHLCLHTAYHHHFRVRLRHLLDVALLLVRAKDLLRLDVVAARAAEWGAARFAYGTLALTRELLGVDVGSAALSHDAADERVVPIAAEFVMTAPLPLPITIRNAERASGVAGKARVYLRSVFLPRAQLRAMYDVPPQSWSLPLYYAVRSLDLARRFATLVTQVGKHHERLPLTLQRERNGVLIDAWVGDGASQAPSSPLARGRSHAIETR